MAIPRLFASTNALLDGGDAPARGSETFGIADPTESSVADLAAPTDGGSNELAADPAAPAAPAKTRDANGRFASAAEPAAAPAAESEPEALDLGEEPTYEEPEAEATPADDFTPELLKQAQESHGWDEATAKRFGTSDGLQFAMAQQDLARAQWGQHQLAAMQQAAAAQQQQQPAQPAQQQQPQQTQQQPNQSLIEKYPFDRQKLVEQGIDDDTINFLEGMANHYNAQLDKVGSLVQPLARTTVAHQQQIDQYTRQSQADDQALFARDMDAFFDKLGPEWEAEFGKGPGVNLIQGSPQWNARVQMTQHVLGLAYADDQSNRQSTTSNRAELAHNALHYEKKQELAKKALAGKVKQRQTQVLTRGGSQRPQPLTGRARAVQRSQQFDNSHRLEHAF